MELTVILTVTSTRFEPKMLRMPEYVPGSRPVGSAVTVSAEGAAPPVGVTLNQVAPGNVVKFPEPLTCNVCDTAGPLSCAEKLSGFLSTASAVSAAGCAQAEHTRISRNKVRLTFFKVEKPPTWQAVRTGGNA